MTTEFHAVKITELRRATPGALHVRLEGGPLALYEAYRYPGMRVDVRATGGGKPAAGSVGIASQPERRYFELLVELGTPLGDALAALGPGAELEVTRALGSGFPAFEFRRHDIYLVGHGAGLGPVRAAALHVLSERGAFDQVRLLAEAHFLDEIPYRDEFPSWQRGGLRIYQTLARPDVGKWRRGEQAYVHDLLADLRPDPARSVVFAAGPADMLQGVHGVLRELELPPERLYLFEVESAARERAREAERPAALLAKLSKEGRHGSGHQKDAPDHAPGYVTPGEQPKGEGLAPYQRVP
jgi:NAD(P)H-flavin reductase